MRQYLDEMNRPYVVYESRGERIRANLKALLLVAVVLVLVCVWGWLWLNPSQRPPVTPQHWDQLE